MYFETYCINLDNIYYRYPEETMQLITELAHDIVGEYRKKQKKKLQRTFVKASDAASSKVKGIFKNCEFCGLLNSLQQSIV